MPEDKYKQRPPDEKYFSKQWEGLREREQDKKRQDAWRRLWLNWQKENIGRAPYSAWLVVPCNLADHGMRPLPATTPCYLSPFIGVLSPDPSGQPLTGSPNQIFARVFNLGAATSAPTRVEFYWADPSVGLGAADAHLVGTETVEIPPMSSEVVTCSTPWIPSYLNGGHECVFVSADNHVLDPLLLPFQPWADRHVGQRNLAVLPAVAQAFKLWMPGGRKGAFAEIKALALRVVAPDGFAGLGTPVQTIAAAADQALKGMRQLPAMATAQFGKRPEVFAQRIDAQMLIEGHRVLDEGRAVCNHEQQANWPLADDAYALGETLFRTESPVGLARQFELRLKHFDLAMNEIALINITCVVAGVVEGGYVLVLANPAWFKNSAFRFPAEATQKENSMNTSKPPHGAPGEQADDRQLRDLVLHFNPLARAALEIAQQLAPHLPIETAEKIGGELRVGGERVEADFLMQYSKSLLPITDTKDLVRKVSAMLRLFAQHGDSYRPVLSDATARFLDELHTTEPGVRGAIPVLHGRGPSLFPLKNTCEKGA